MQEMTAYSSILAWKIPWTEEPGGLHSMGSQRVQCNWATEYSPASPSRCFQLSTPSLRAPRQWIKTWWGCFQILALPLNSYVLSKLVFQSLWCWLKTHNWKVELCLKDLAATAATKSLQSCSTLCDPIDGSPPGPAVPGILQARTPDRVAISSSNALKWKVKVKSLSRIRLLVTTWTAAYQAPLSIGFSRQEYWSGLPLPSLKDLTKD